MMHTPVDALTKNLLGLFRSRLGGELPIEINRDKSYRYVSLYNNYAAVVRFAGLLIKLLFKEILRLSVINVQTCLFG